MKKEKRIQISKHWSLYMTKYGECFAGGFVVFPTIVIHFMKDYYQFSFCFLNRSYDYTLFFLQ